MDLSVRFDQDTGTINVFTRDPSEDPQPTPPIPEDPVLTTHQLFQSADQVRFEQELARKLNLYWYSRGYPGMMARVEDVVEEGPSGVVLRYRAVRSNMVNGVPPT